MVNRSQYPASIRDIETRQALSSNQNNFWKIRENTFLQLEAFQGEIFQQLINFKNLVPILALVLHRLMCMRASLHGEKYCLIIRQGIIVIKFTILTSLLRIWLGVVHKLRLQDEVQWCA